MLAQPDPTYLPRVIDRRLDLLLPELPAILLDGAKGVGKTATALRRAATVRRLDVPNVAAVAQAGVDAFIDGPEPVLLDEWQRVPALWDAVKRSVDRDGQGGRFLLTGSAATRGDTHSGAGRIAELRMRPMTLPERGTVEPAVSLAAIAHGSASIAGETSASVVDYARAIARSGFPGLQHLSGDALRTQLDGYLTRVVERDMSGLGLVVRRPETVRGWLRAYAAATATTASWEKIRNAATPGSDHKPAKTTTFPYIDCLTALRIIDDLPAWDPGSSHLSRMGRAPKHHIVDPALAVRLLRLTEADLLTGQAEPVVLPRDGAFLGALFESLAVLSVRTFAEAIGATVSHCRTSDGRHEIDVIVELPDGGVVAVEAKLAAAVSDNDVKHLVWLRDRLGDRLIAAMVITTGQHAYRRPDGFAVVPLALLGP